MAYEIPGFSFALPAGADFATGGVQFRFVNVAANGTAIVPTLGGPVVGVRYTRSKLGTATTIVNSGIAMVESGDATIVAGTLVTTDATGRALTAGTGNYVAGQALEASSATGIVIAVLLGTRAKA